MLRLFFTFCHRLFQVPHCGSDGITYMGSCEFDSAKCKNPGLENLPFPENLTVTEQCDVCGNPTVCTLDLVSV